MNTYTLKVTALRKETEDTVTLGFKQPGLKKIKYQAGQYLTLIFRIKGRRYLRPYSFSSASGVDTLLEVTIKRVPNGVVSNYINDELKIDDVVEVLPPMGDFVHPPENLNTPIFLWGVGSGITPLFAIAKDILHHRKSENLNIQLIYGNQNVAQTIFYEKINELQTQFSNHFFPHFFFSRETSHLEKSEHYVGRIVPEKILDKFEGAQLPQSIHYICGPIALKNQIKQSLIAHNIPTSSIFVEDFELVKDFKDFEHIIDRNVELIYEGKTHFIPVNKGKSILEAGLDYGLELPYSCQTGSCSTCKGMLKRGDVQMIGLPAERNDLEISEYLLCCSYPINDEIIIEI